MRKRKKKKREKGQEKKKGLRPCKRHIYVKTVLQTNQLLRGTPTNGFFFFLRGTPTNGY